MEYFGEQLKVQLSRPAYVNILRLRDFPLNKFDRNAKIMANDYHEFRIEAKKCK
jgi:hypothetical protein